MNNISWICWLWLSPVVVMDFESGELYAWKSIENAYGRVAVWRPDPDDANSKHTFARTLQAGFWNFSALDVLVVNSKDPASLT